jgi:hypothetical protein
LRPWPRAGYANRSKKKNVREIVAKFQMVKDDPASLLDLDRELGARTPDAKAGDKENA